VSGRRAALPDPRFRRPDPLQPGGRWVVHVSEKGDDSQIYDFGKLPVSAELQGSFAKIFAGKLGPGGWRTVQASRGGFRELATFARFLSELDRPPAGITEITPATWNAWRLSRPGTATGQRSYTRIGGLLRRDPRLPADTYAVSCKQVKEVKATETAYSAEHFAAVTSAAARLLAGAVRRISASERHLARWRAGAVAEGTEEWRLGEALDSLARTGDVPHQVRLNGRGRTSRQRYPDRRYAGALGGQGVAAAGYRLCLTPAEAAALAVSIVAAYGWNSTTVSELRVPQIMSEPGEGSQVIYRMELEKRRRYEPYRYESRNLTDWGPRSPGRLITQALAATAPARAILEGLGAPTDRLIVWRKTRSPITGDPATHFRSGFGPVELVTWARATGLEVNLRRLRRTVVVLHRRAPAQHSQDVHDSVYVLREPAARQEAIPVIAAGAADAISHAREVVRARRGTPEDTAGPGADTATASCGDYRHSPFSPHGAPCRVSFLLCLACPNAVVTSRHLPRLACLHRALDELRGVLPAGLWDHDWREHHARLQHIRQEWFTAAEWSDALRAVTAADRQTISDLLGGGPGA
jgi:hypothetical protein